MKNKSELQFSKKKASKSKGISKSRYLNTERKLLLYTIKAGL